MYRKKVWGKKNKKRKSKTNTVLLSAKKQLLELFTFSGTCE